MCKINLGIKIYIQLMSAKLLHSSSQTVCVCECDKRHKTVAHWKTIQLRMDASVLAQKGKWKWKMGVQEAAQNSIYEVAHEQAMPCQARPDYAMPCQAAILSSLFHLAYDSLFPCLHSSPCVRWHVKWKWKCIRWQARRDLHGTVRMRELGVWGLK